jgi:hypothetical protein
MKKTFLMLITICFLSACGQYQPSATLSATIEVLAPTASPITPALPGKTVYPTKTPVPKATRTIEPTEYPASEEWIVTYPTKKALVIYGATSRNEYTINFVFWGFDFFEPYFVIYEDGQMIFGTGAYQKQLTPDEIEEIFTRLDDLGFYQIQDAYEADPENPNYQFPGGLMPVPDLNSPNIELTVNGETSKSIHYMQNWEKYLIQPMKDIFSYVNSITPDDVTPYQPDRLLVSSFKEENCECCYSAYKNPKTVPWPSEVIAPTEGGIYLKGSKASDFYKATGGELAACLSFEGESYLIILRPILPHECHFYHFYSLEDMENDLPYFTCGDW